MLYKLSRHENIIRIVADKDVLAKFIIDELSDICDSDSWCKADCKHEECSPEMEKECIKRWLCETVLVDIEEDCKNE